MSAVNKFALYSDLACGNRNPADLSQEEALVAAPLFAQEAAYMDAKHASHAHAVELVRGLYAQAYPEDSEQAP